MSPSPSAVARGVLAACLAVLLASCGADPAVLEIREAQFVASSSPAPPGPDAGWEARPLPDAWAASKPPRTGFGWYRFELPAPAPRGDSALYLTATQSNAQLFVNGRLAAQSGDLEGEPPVQWEAAQLYPVPRALLKEAGNVAHLRVYTPPGTGGGIGPVLVGAHEPIYLRALRDQVGYVVGPAAVGITMLVLGAFMLFLWLRVREDRNYLLFAVAAILWGVHTATTILPRDLMPPPHWTIWWNAMYVIWVVLLCIFCVRFTRARRPIFERWAAVAAIASIPILYAAAGAGVLGIAAAGVRLGAIGAALFTLYAVTEHAVRARDTTSWILVATGAVACAFGLHDWLASQRAGELRPLQLVPYVSLAFFVLIGWMMIDRFVRTLRAREQLNAELEARVRFIASASHDLRQPLHALGLFASALDEHESDPTRRELTGRINQSIVALETLFNEVLDVSRLDAGAVQPRIAPVPLQPLFDRVERDLAPVADEKGVALRMVPTRVAVRSDPILLERILRNLVSNAIRYTPSGAVLVGVRRRGARLAIEVRDSGVGIAPEHHARVFEEFWQLGEAATDRRPGLGLGLSIVRRLARLLGHEVTLRSAPGRGSTFAVTLDSEAVPDTLLAQPEALPGGPGGLRVAIVDDDPDVRDSTSALLRTWGCEPMAYDCVEAALGEERARPPDVVLLDYRLRDGIDGVEAAARLRKAWGESLPVILISGESSAENIAHMRASGLPVLHKPVPPARLRGLLAHVRAQASG